MHRSFVVAHVPVIHRGYLEFFRKEKLPVYVIDDVLLSLFPECRIQKDIRRISPTEAVSALLGLGVNAHALSLGGAKHLNALRCQITAPDEDITRKICEKFFGDCSVQYQSIFLRWHTANVADEKAVVPDRVESTDSFLVAQLKLSIAVAKKSPDWWRLVGGVLYKENNIIAVGYNSHVPDQYTTALLGDPRSLFKKGVAFELTRALHAEQSLIGEAAQRGVSTLGASLVTTVFPCPPCAWLIRSAGISVLYFLKGYSALEGEEILKEAGVKIIQLAV